MAEQRIPYDLPQLEKRQLWATSPWIAVVVFFVLVALVGVAWVARRSRA